MEFANKEYLFLLLLVIPYLLWYLMYRKKSEPTMRVADTFAYRFAPKSWKVRLMPLQMLLRVVAFVMLVIVLARPQTQNSWKNKTVEGIDIMLAIDVSTSMLAEDLKPNRLEAAKQVAAEFISGRPDDNIGLTIFAGEAFTQCPMTTDHSSLLNLLQNVRTNIAHGNMGVRLFEVANVFEADPASQTTAKESARLGMVMYGSLYDTAWPNAEIDAGYADIRGLVEHLAAFLNLPAPVFTRDENAHPFLAPCVRVAVDGKPVGVVGQAKAQLADAYHARKRIWLAELDLETLWDLHRAARIVFKALAVFPASSRDVTVIAPLTLSVAAVEKHIRDMRIAILEDVTLIDLYEPKDKEERNLTFRLTFRKADRTLKDAEVDKEREKVAQSLIKNLGVRI